MFRMLSLDNVILSMVGKCNCQWFMLYMYLFVFFVCVCVCLCMCVYRFVCGSVEFCINIWFIFLLQTYCILFLDCVIVDFLSWLHENIYTMFSMSFGLFINICLSFENNYQDDCYTQRRKRLHKTRIKQKPKKKTRNSNTHQ